MKILLVDDSRYERTLISSYLHEKGHEVVIAGNGQQAVDAYPEVRPDLVLMDVVMPEMNGYAAARRLRMNNQDWVPIIFLSACVSAEEIAAGIQAGGDDYLTKPVNHVVLEAKMIAMQRIAARQHTLLDVSHELEQANTELKQLVNIDGLTGLSNRRYLDQILRNEISRGSRQSEPLSIIMADVDYFKAYNDHYGHVAGDNCLKAIGKVLMEAVRRGGDVVARYGGEEFVMILPNTPVEGARVVAESVRARVEKLKLPHVLSSVASVCTLSAGVYTCLPRQNENIDALMKKADACLYLAKANGRNCIIAECCDMHAIKNNVAECQY